MNDSSFPSSWRMVSLESCVQILDSMRVPVNNTERAARIEGKNANELYPYYGATGRVGLIDEYIFDDDLVALGEDGVPFLDPTKAKAYSLRGKTWVNNHAHVLKALEGLTTNTYIRHYLNAFDYQGYVNGATRLKLTQANMRRIPIPLASLDEQKQIANKLDELLAQVDSIKARLDAIPAILKRFRQSVLAAAVSGGLTEDWRGKVAKSWKSYAIGDIAIVLNGKAFPSKEYADNGIRLLRPGNLHVTGKVVWTDKNSTFLPEVWAERRPELLLTAGALLMNLTAQSLKDEFLGRVCVLGQSSEPVLLNQRIASFESRLDYDITPYLYVYFKSPLFREFVDTLDSGTLIKHMSTNDVLNHRITLPDSAEQTEIVRRVKHLFTFADQIEQRLTEAQTRINQLTQSILAKAFHGALTADWREQHPELISGEHSAEALLAQIQAARAKLETNKRARRKKVAST